MLLQFVKKSLLIFFLLLFLFGQYTQAQNKNKQFVVTIDAGHGGKDAGAIGSTSKEKNINLAVVLLLGDLIEKNHPDVKVIYTRKTDRFVELDKRADIANKAKSDLFISIHTNSVKKSKTVTGTETYALGLSRTEENLAVAKLENSAILLEDNYEQRYEGFDPNSSESYIIFEFMQNKFIDQSIEFASSIQKEFSNSAKRVDRGVKQAEFLVLRKTTMPGVLIELGFISTDSEERYLNSDEGREKLSLCIYNAFQRYKRGHDRKLGMQNENHHSTTTNTDTLNPSVQKENENLAVDEQRNKNQNQTVASGLVYKVQILASDKQLSSKSPLLKGYKNADFYIENGFYKYTYGESSSWSEIVKVWKSILKDFSDAFIIKFENGIKVPNK